MLKPRTFLLEGEVSMPTSVGKTGLERELAGKIVRWVEYVWRTEQQVAGFVSQIPRFLRQTIVQMLLAIDGIVAGNPCGTTGSGSEAEC